MKAKVQTKNYRPTKKNKSKTCIMQAYMLTKIRQKLKKKFKISKFIFIFKTSKISICIYITSDHKRKRQTA